MFAKSIVETANDAWAVQTVRQAALRLSRPEAAAARAPARIATNIQGTWIRQTTARLAPTYSIGLITAARQPSSSDAAVANAVAREAPVARSATRPVTQAPGRICS